jgi:small-conductance mechanosensitive channel
MDFSELLNLNFENINTISTIDLIKPFVVTIITFFILTVTFQFIGNRLKNIASKTSVVIDDLVADILSSFNNLFYFSIALLAGIYSTELPEDLSDVVLKILIIILVFYFTKALIIVIEYGVEKFFERRELSPGESRSIRKVLMRVLSALVWSLAILIIIQNLGFNVGALLGGLGVAGIALAFGIQNLLEDSFAYFSIYFDKPFSVGDIVKVGDDWGRIKSIGIKSTRLISTEGEELIIPNKDLTSSRISNYKDLPDRRIEFELGITYDTSKENLKRIPEIIENIVNETSPNTEFERSHLTEFGDSAIKFSTVYHISQDSDKEFIDNLREFLDIQQNVYFKILDKFEENSIGLAFPTQTIHIKNSTKRTNDKKN